MSLTYGTVCSGIEAPSCAVDPLGWKPLWFSEIEPFPKAVLAHRHPGVPDLGDMTTLPARILAGEVPAPDVFIGGTPCQSFSVAGLRKGLADPRGQLTRTFVEILDAIDTVRLARGESPCVALWENVPGVLSDKDNAFGNFLAALVGEDDALLPAGPRWTNAGSVLGPGRSLAWRVLDAQYFGVAQRRRRVFVVVSARAGGVDPVEVLLVEPGVRRDPPTRGEAREDAATHARPSAAFWNGADVAESLTCTSDDQRMPDKGRMQMVVQSMAVRRLTPEECERLQGFPDGHTAIPWKGKPASECPDGPRYKALGNSMAVPVIAWIARKIAGARG
ncbi:MAG: hypothetical protein RLZZ299_768 [Pseudomonadota bacterium]|jgi:DNA (cytosine-5)-methyltransferase 1